MYRRPVLCTFYFVNFCDSIYNGSGSATTKSYGSGSATLITEGAVDIASFPADPGVPMFLLVSLRTVLYCTVLYCTEQ